MKNKNYSHKNAIHHKTDEEIKKEITAIELDEFALILKSIKD